MESTIFNILEFLYPRLLEIPIEIPFPKKKEGKRDLEYDVKVV
jgi:hypothetical protein